MNDQIAVTSADHAIMLAQDPNVSVVISAEMARAVLSALGERLDNAIESTDLSMIVTEHAAIHTAAARIAEGCQNERTAESLRALANSTTREMAQLRIAKKLMTPEQLKALTTSMQSKGA